MSEWLSEWGKKVEGQMPDFVQAWIETLSDKHRLELESWLRGDDAGSVVTSMIEVVSESGE